MIAVDPVVGHFVGSRIAATLYFQLEAPGIYSVFDTIFKVPDHDCQVLILSRGEAPVLSTESRIIAGDLKAFFSKTTQQHVGVEHGFA